MSRFAPILPGHVNAVQNPVSDGLAPFWALLAQVQGRSSDMGSVPGWVILGLLLGAAICATAFWWFRRSVDPGGSNEVSLLLDGDRVVSANGAAKALLKTLDVGASGPAMTLARFRAALPSDNRAIDRVLDNLVQQGEAFSMTLLLDDGRDASLQGAPEGALVRLTLAEADPKQIALDRAEARAERLAQQRDHYCDLLNRAPIQVSVTDSTGALSWANKAYRDLVIDNNDTPQLLAYGAVTAASDVPDLYHLFPLDQERVNLVNRLQLAVDPDQKVQIPRDDKWCSLKRETLPDAGEVRFGTPIDDLVQAELSQRNFVLTLSATFAHLAIGLAVFDDRGRLSLFNPALSDITELDPTALIQRPRLRDFLDALREGRKTPEHGNFAEWRRCITRLEEGARDGTYCEDWTLPSGDVIRVTGRPHPDGAVALLFEDISRTVSLERRYRGEIELSQATLDRIGQAIAVFDTAGALVFANAAFDVMWGIDTMNRQDAPGIAGMTEIWRRRCDASDAWDDIQAFVTGTTERKTWRTALHRKDGRGIRAEIAPLPDGGTLTLFTESREEIARAASPDIRSLRARIELGIDGILEVAEATAANLQQGVPAAEASNQLVEAVSEARRLLVNDLGPEPEIGANTKLGELFRGPAAFIESRDLTVELDCQDLPLPLGLSSDMLRRLSWSLALSAADIGGEGHTVRLAAYLGKESKGNGSEQTEAALVMRADITAPRNAAVTPIHKGKDMRPNREPVSLRLLQRYCRAVGVACELLEKEGHDAVEATSVILTAHPDGERWRDRTGAQTAPVTDAVVAS